MPRLFSGFRVSEEAEEWLSSLELDMYGARWTDPSDYHVTLRFFGDVDRHMADDIAAGLSAARQVSFTAVIKGLAAYGGDRPRNLVAEIAPNPALEDLRRAHERIAVAAGLPPERRKYSPHVTIARLVGTRPETIARFIQSFTKPRLPAWDVGEAVLFSSRPGTGGGPYVPEETFKLARNSSGTSNAPSA